MFDQFAFLDLGTPELIIILAIILLLFGVSIASLFGFSTLMGVLSGSDTDTNGSKSGGTHYGAQNYGP